MLNPEHTRWMEALRASYADEKAANDAAWEVYEAALPFRWWDRPRFLAAADALREADAAMYAAISEYERTHPEPPWTVEPTAPRDPDEWHDSIHCDALGKEYRDDYEAGR